MMYDNVPRIYSLLLSALEKRLNHEDYAYATNVWLPLFNKYQTIFKMNAF